MKIGILAPGYPPAYLGGGPIRTVHALARIAADRHEVNVVTRNRDLGQEIELDVPPDQWVTRGGVDVYYASATRLAMYASALRKLRSREPDVVYLNSYFSPRFSLVPRLLHRLGWWNGATLILAPRGELSGGALGIKSSKKRALLLVARLIDLDRGAIWHASSEREAVDIRRTIPGARSVLVRPNETDLPPNADPPARTAHTVPRFVFVSRIVPMKGLDLALRALAEVEETLNLDVFGGEEDPQYADLCRALARELPAHVQVTFRGPLPPEQVRPTIGTYDALVLPTRGENFGHVIAEALSVSCPVLTTDATPWTGVLEEGGGVVSLYTTEAWARTFDRYARRVRAERATLRRRAGVAYEAWRSQQEGPTVFDMFADSVSSESKKKRGWGCASAQHGNYRAGRH